jgi:dihydropteroate synthase
VTDLGSSVGTDASGRPGPRVMGILNVSVESFSGGVVGPGDAVRAAASMLADGADILDIGAQSLRTDQEELVVDVEVGRLLSVLEPVRAAFPDAVISADTYRYEVARAAVDVGVQMINDPSGLLDDRIGELVASSDADLVLAYNRSRPKHRITREELVADPVADCVEFVRARLRRLQDVGVDPARVVFDPGPDLGKSPDQSINLLRAVPELRDALDLGRVMWALSRKDFIGALLHRLPAGRWSGTLGAMSALDVRDGDVLRVHDVRGTSDFLTIRRALLDGVTEPLVLPDELRYDV